MRLRWYGQSAFLLDERVLIDPFGDLGALGRRWDYPAIEPVEVELLVITHEHIDHNHAASALGDPFVVRSQAGTFADTPVGEVVSVASEHDAVAGTQRGANTLVCFTLDGLRVCHLGDLGQPALRPEQIAAIGSVDLLFVPVGGGPTLGADEAAATVAALGPRWVVPMHYRTAAIDFLETADAFVATQGAVDRWDGPEGELGADGVVLPAPPI